jgi:hypothetical protein
LSLFPQVRGFYLAKHLQRSGLKAEFRPLPQPGVECRVLIWSEYESTLGYFREHFESRLRRIRADRMFCLAGIGAPPGYFSAETGRWFATEGRGGVLCHFVVWKPRPYERLIGLGVDLDAMPTPAPVRDTVLFDLPTEQSVSAFDPRVLPEIRRQLPDCRLVVMGPDGIPFRDQFDGWWRYGRSHPEFVQAYGQAFAMVPGCRESMGLSIAEAQVSGASIVSADGEILPHMVVSRFGYSRSDGASLARALAAARDADSALVAEQARRRFDFDEVVKRVRSAIAM